MHPVNMKAGYLKNKKIGEREKEREREREREREGDEGVERLLFLYF